MRAYGGALAHSRALQQLLCGWACGEGPWGLESGAPLLVRRAAHRRARAIDLDLGSCSVSAVSCKRHDAIADGQHQTAVEKKKKRCECSDLPNNRGSGIEEGHG
eukprot:Amastigsp_a6848_31.p5 type:complete len:104 gc:universal Amastigsp_a6848_31:356-45(-)